MARTEVTPMGRRRDGSAEVEAMLGEAARRYRRGESRSQVFCDLVLGTIASFGGEAVNVADIGCGDGFDGRLDLQRAVAGRAARFVGIEPDPAVKVPEFFTEVHTSFFEDAPLEPGSVHVAYSTFVLEHIKTPARFWESLHRALAPGGVFWGFTMDARHAFTVVSTAMGALGLKDLYLDKLHGRKDEGDRYQNYPTFYRANSPRQIRRHARMFSSARFLSLQRVGHLDFYVPRRMRLLMHGLDRLAMALRLPGSLLVVRLEK